jgi:hypothetical protein
MLSPSIIPSRPGTRSKAAKIAHGSARAGTSQRGNIAMAHDQADNGRERRLRYCARPPFALDRLRELDPEQSTRLTRTTGPTTIGLARARAGPRE